MKEFNKTKIEEDIVKAYENQTEKVRNLLVSAKNNLKQDKKTVTLKTTKGKAEQIYLAGEFINRGNKDKNKIENLLKTGFEETNQNIKIHSKNLDFIIDSVSEREKEETELLSKIVEQTEEYKMQMEEEFSHIKEQSKVHNQKIQSKLEKIKTRNIQNNVEIQEMLKNIKKNNEDSEKILKSSMEELKDKTIEENSQTMDTLKNIQEQAFMETAKVEKKIEEFARETVQNNLENLNQIQEENSKDRLNVKNEIVEHLQDMKQAESVSAEKIKLDLENIKEITQNKYSQIQENLNQMQEENGKDRLNVKNEIVENVKSDLEKLKELTQNGHNVVKENLSLIEQEGKSYHKYMIEVKDELADYMQNIKVENNEGLEKILDKQEKVLTNTMQIQDEIKEKSEETKKFYEESLNSLKQEIIAEYAKSIDVKVEEKIYLWSQIEEKNKEIHKLQNKIYEYQMKLEKEKSKRKYAFWNGNKKEEEEENQTKYACQILNSIMY